MRIAFVMLDQNYGGMQQAFLNYSIELSKRGLPVPCVIRNESFVEKKLREAGISSIAIINNRFGFYDPFAIRQIGGALDEFFSYPPPHIVQSFGARATLFASKLKSQARSWPLIASLPNSINHKYYKGADILVPSRIFYGVPSATIDGNYEKCGNCHSRVPLTAKEENPKRNKNIQGGHTHVIC